MTTGRSTSRADSRPLGTVALATTSLTLAISFSRVFEYWQFLVPLLVVALVSHTAAFVMRRGSVTAPIALLSQTILVYVVNAWMHVRDTLWFGIPLGRTWSEITSRVGDSARLLGDVKPPLEFATGFGLAAGFAIGMVAILSDAFAFRAAGRGEALVPGSVVFAVVAIVGEDRHRSLVTAAWLVSAIIAVTVLRRSDSFTGGLSMRDRVRTTSATVGTSIVVAVLAMWVGPRLPGADSEPLIGRDTDSGRVVEPLVDVRGRLGDRSDTVLFTVVSDRPSYWRLTSLPEFDGSTWGVSQDEFDTAGGRLADGADPTSSWFVTQTVTIQNLRGNLAPAAYEASELRAASRSLYYALDSGTLLVNGNELGASDSYTIVSAVADPAVPVLDFLTSLSPPSSTYVELPDNEEMKRLGDLAREITSGAESGYRAAIDLQTYFRENFTYSLDVPALGDERSHLEFIERGSGYCEQFASTFAVMARSIGLPTRVAIGFTPGEDDGNGTYTVRSQHAHAWPEVWFDGVGWLMFEPTPGRGAPDRGYTGVEPQQDDTSPTPTATTTPPPQTETPNPAVTTTTSPATATTIAGTNTVETDSGSHGSGPDGSTSIVLLVVLTCLAWPVMVRVVVARAARHDTTPAVLVLWRRLLAEEGITGDLDLTATEIARRLNASTTERPIDADSADATVRLAEAVDRLLFAQRLPSPEEMNDLVVGIEKRLDAMERRRHRIARHLSPAVALRLAGRA